MSYSQNICEEELKNKVAADYFAAYDTTQIVGNIDFCVVAEDEVNTPYLWAEAQKGLRQDIYESFVQLILTIGKARAYEKNAAAVSGGL